MEEKSALDLLKEMYFTQKALSVRMVNLEEALMLVLKELREKKPELKEEKKEEEVFVMSTVEPEPKEEKPKIKPAKNIRVTGYIKGESDKGISGVKVTIFDGRNNTVKITKTNRAGAWFSFLPPNKYIAHYLSEKPKINQNVNFEVKSTDTEVVL